MVISMQQGINDLHMVQLMPMPPCHFSFRKIHSGSPLWYWVAQVVQGKIVIKRVLLLLIKINWMLRKANSNAS